MRTIRIADAKNNLSRHLEYVRRGGRIRILNRNTPVADLVPVEPEPASSGGDDDCLIADLVRRGIARPPRDTGPIPADLLRPGLRSKRSVVEALIEERRSGR